MRGGSGMVGMKTERDSGSHSSCSNPMSAYPVTKQPHFLGIHTGDAWMCSASAKDMWKYVHSRTTYHSSKLEMTKCPKTAGCLNNWSVFTITVNCTEVGMNIQCKWLSNTRIKQEIRNKRVYVLLFCISVDTQFKTRQNYPVALEVRIAVTPDVGIVTGWTLLGFWVSSLILGCSHLVRNSLSYIWLWLLYFSICICYASKKFTLKEKRQKEKFHVACGSRNNGSPRMSTN